MKRCVCAVLLAVVPALALAQSGLGKRELALSGSGASTRDLDAGGFSATGEYGYYLTPQLEVGVRQSITWEEKLDRSNWHATTGVYSDYNFGTAEWRPYIGASMGLIYGNDADETMFAGPEVGVKYYVQAAAFLFAQVQYQFIFGEAGDAVSNFDDSAFSYSFGAGYNF